MTTTSPATPANPLSPIPAHHPRCGAGPLCWKLTAAGNWTTVHAPWKKTLAEDWFFRHADRLVFTTRLANDADTEKPAVEVYEVIGSDVSDAGAVFVGCFEAMEDSRWPDRSAVGFYFLVEPPAVAKLIADFAAILTVHPSRSDITRMKRGTRVSRHSADGKNLHRLSDNALSLIRDL